MSLFSHMQIVGLLDHVAAQMTNSCCTDDLRFGLSMFFVVLSDSLFNVYILKAKGDDDKGFQMMCLI